MILMHNYNHKKRAASASPFKGSKRTVLGAVPTKDTVSVDPANPGALRLQSIKFEPKFV